MLETLSRHRQAFEDLYSGLFRTEDNQLRFPLEDVERLDWRRGQYANAFYNYMYRRFSSHILSRLALTGTERILILGCGRGNDEKNIKRLFPATRLWSVDIARAMLKSAIVSRSPSTFAAAAAEALPFPENSFDRVLSREVIEHVLDPPMMLQEIGRVLKPRGIAVVTTENEDSFAIGNRPYERLRGRIYRVFGLNQSEPKSWYKDEAPTLDEIVEWARAADLELSEIIWDGALYQTLPHLQKLIRGRRLASFAHRVSALENLKQYAFYFCDQAKFVLIKPDRNATFTCNEPRFCKPGTNLPLFLEEGSYVCEETGERFEVLAGIPELMPPSNGSQRGEADEKTPPTWTKSSPEQGAANWLRRRLVGVVLRILNFWYPIMLVLTGLSATFFATANKDRPSHVLKEGDPYLRFIHF